jgi:RNA 2',3'-cyclic 3'-phosphodiesterase
MSAIRTFIALPASSVIQQQIAIVQSKLKTIQADVKWELQDKFHITLKFLGSLEQSKIELLSTALAGIVKQFPSFEITYNSLGAFPDLHHPRVIWIGTEFNQIVLDLQTNIDRVCTDFGFQKEERTFHPHITLGRVKGTINLARLTDAIKTVTFEPLHSRCSELFLMKSDLRLSGSIYTILKSFPLQP